MFKKLQSKANDATAKAAAVVKKEEPKPAASTPEPAKASPAKTEEPPKKKGLFGSLAKPADSSPKKEEPKKEEPKKSGGMFGGLKDKAAAAVKKEEPKKDDGKKDEPKKSGGMFGGLKDKAAAATASATAAVKKEEPKKDDGKKDEPKKSGGMFGGLKDKAAAATASASAAVKKEEPKKDDGKKDEPKKSGGMFGGLKDKAAAATASATAAVKKDDDTPKKSGGMFGGLKDKAAAAVKKDDTKEGSPKKSGGMFGGLKDKAAAATASATAAVKKDDGDGGKKGGFFSGLKDKAKEGAAKAKDFKESGGLDKLKEQAAAKAADAKKKAEEAKEKAKEKANEAKAKAEEMKEKAKDFKDNGGLDALKEKAASKANEMKDKAKEVQNMGAAELKAKAAEVGKRVASKTGDMAKKVVQKVVEKADVFTLKLGIDTNATKEEIKAKKAEFEQKARALMDMLRTDFTNITEPGAGPAKMQSLQTVVKASKNGDMANHIANMRAVDPLLQCAEEEGQQAVQEQAGEALTGLFRSKTIARNQYVRQHKGVAPALTRVARSEITSVKNWGARAYAHFIRNVGMGMSTKAFKGDGMRAIQELAKSAKSDDDLDDKTLAALALACVSYHHDLQSQIGKQGKEFDGIELLSSELKKNKSSEQKAILAGAIAELLTHRDNKWHPRLSSLIPQFITVLGSSDAKQRSKITKEQMYSASSAMKMLCEIEANHELFVNPTLKEEVVMMCVYPGGREVRLGAISAMSRIAKSDNDKASPLALSILISACEEGGRDVQKDICDSGVLGSFVDAAKKIDNPPTHLRGIQGLAVLSANTENHPAILNAKALNTFGETLESTIAEKNAKKKNSETTEQIISTCILGIANIAKSSSGAKKAAEQNLIPKIVSHCNSTSIETQARLATALGNLSKVADNKEQINDNLGMLYLVRYCQKKRDITVRRAAARALGKLLAGSRINQERFIHGVEDSGEGQDTSLRRCEGLDVMLEAMMANEDPELRKYATKVVAHAASLDEHNKSEIVAHSQGKALTLLLKTVGEPNEDPTKSGLETIYWGRDFLGGKDKKGGKSLSFNIMKKGKKKKGDDKDEPPRMNITRDHLLKAQGAACLAISNLCNGCPDAEVRLMEMPGCGLTNVLQLASEPYHAVDHRNPTRKETPFQKAERVRLQEKVQKLAADAVTNILSDPRPDLFDKVSDTILTQLVEQVKQFLLGPKPKDADVEDEPEDDDAIDAENKELLELQRKERLAAKKRRIGARDIVQLSAITAVNCLVFTRFKVQGKSGGGESLKTLQKPENLDEFLKGILMYCGSDKEDVARTATRALSRFLYDCGLYNRSLYAKLFQFWREMMTNAAAYHKTHLAGARVIVMLLMAENRNLKTFAAEMLCNVFRGDPPMTRYSFENDYMPLVSHSFDLFEAGAMTQLVSLMCSKEREVVNGRTTDVGRYYQKLGATAIARLSEEPKTHNKILLAGGLNSLISLCKYPVRKNATSAHIKAKKRAKEAAAAKQAGKKGEVTKLTEEDKELEKESKQDAEDEKALQNMSAADAALLADVVIAAATAIANLARNPRVAYKIVEAGALDAIMPKLRSASIPVRVAATQALAYLSADVDNQAVIEDRSPPGHRAVLNACLDIDNTKIRNYVENPDKGKKRRKPKKGKMSLDIQTETPEELREKSALISDCRMWFVIQAAGCITLYNLAETDSVARRILHSKKGIKALIKLIYSPDKNVIAMALMALSRLARTPTGRHVIATSDALKAVINLANQKDAAYDPQIARYISLVFSNVCERETYLTTLIKSGALGPLMNMADNNSFPDNQTLALHAVARLCKNVALGKVTDKAEQMDVFGDVKEETENPSGLQMLKSFFGFGKVSKEFVDLDKLDKHMRAEHAKSEKQREKRARKKGQAFVAREWNIDHFGDRLITMCDQLCHEEDPDLQLAAATIVLNLVDRVDPRCRRVNSQKIIQHRTPLLSSMIQLSRSEQFEIRSTAGTAIAFLALNGESHDAIIRYGGMQALLDLAKSGNEDLQVKCAHAFKGLAMTVSSKTLLQDGMFDALEGLTDSTNDIVKELAGDAMGTLFPSSRGKKKGR